LQGGNALAGTGNLEVHVAVVIFSAGDVGKDGVVVAFLDQAHRYAGDRALELDAGVVECEASAADRGHGRRAVGLEDVGNDADGVWGFFRAGKNRGDGALCECTVTDLAPSGTAHASRLAYAERRKVVMEHEVLALFAFVALEALAVVGSAQGGGNQCLGLTASEQGRAVGTGQNAGLDG